MHLPLQGRYSFFKFLAVALLCFPVFNANAIDKDKDKDKGSKDTVQAIVLYGKKFLFEPGKYKTEGELLSYIDSLLAIDEVPKDILEEVNIFLSIRTKPDHYIYSLIDSLFDQEKISYPLINQINYYLATRVFKNNEPEHTVSLTGFYNATIYPSDDFYQSWNTEITHPYLEDLSEKDTSLLLVLADTLNYCYYAPPVKGIVTSLYGLRDGKPHNGIDIDLQTGDPVASTFDGMVRIARKHGGYGNVVVVRHYNGLETLYAHLNKIKVKPGQVVQAGQVIGTGGNTGRSSGSHLHFEVRFKGKPLNPKHIISFNNHKLHSNSIVLNKTKFSYSAFPEGTLFHKVERGESLSEIAQRYGLDVSKICSLNGISKRSVLKPGQKLRVS